MIECTPFIYSQPSLFSILDSSFEFDLDQVSSHLPLLCYVLPLFSQCSCQSTYVWLFFSPIHGCVNIAHFIYHHLWFPPTIVTLLAIQFSLPSLFSIFPASYLWKWQWYLQPLSSGFTDRENGGGDHIRPGPGLWRMIGWACIWLHLWNLICSHCWEASESEQRRRDVMQCNTMGLEKKWGTEKMGEKERQRMTSDGDRWE